MTPNKNLVGEVHSKNRASLKSPQKLFLILMFLLTLSNISKAQYCSSCVTCEQAVNQLNNYAYQAYQYYLWEWYTGIPYNRCPQYYAYGYYNNYWEVNNCHQQMYAYLNQWYAQEVTNMNNWYQQIMYNCTNNTPTTTIRQPTNKNTENSQVSVPKIALSESQAKQKVMIEIPDNPTGFRPR